MNDPHPICPGIATLLDGETPRFIAVPVTIFWVDGTYPDGEYVYLTQYPLAPLDSDKFAQINADILAAANATGAFAGRVSKVAFSGLIGCQLTEAQHKAAGWRVITGSKSQPNTPGVSPAPTPTPTPTPAPVLAPGATTTPAPSTVPEAPTTGSGVPMGGMPE